MRNYPISSDRERLHRKGYSFVELLSVLGIVSLLSFFAGPSLIGLLGVGVFENALNQVSSELELAHEYAISHNTYTYVGFTNPNSQGEIYMAIFGTQDGSTGGVANVSTGSGAIATGTPVAGTGSSSLYLLSRVIPLRGLSFADALPTGSSVLNNSALVATSTAAALPTATAFTFSTQLYNDGSGAGMITFKRAIQFTPEGEGRVGAYVPAAVQLLLAPTVGHSAKIKTEGTSVVQVTGGTGQITTIRP